MIPATRRRVGANTRTGVNRQIREAAERRLAYYAAHPERIEDRLRELDREWDVERMIETEGPAMTGLGMWLGATVDRRWLALSLFAQGMMLLHSLQGFYPMLPVLRRMGFRTEAEIAAERYALRALRGDFAGAAEPGAAFERSERAYSATALRPAVA